MKGQYTNYEITIILSIGSITSQTFWVLWPAWAPIGVVWPDCLDRVPTLGWGTSRTHSSPLSVWKMHVILSMLLLDTCRKIFHRIKNKPLPVYMMHAPWGSPPHYRTYMHAHVWMHVVSIYSIMQSSSYRITQLYSCMRWCSFRLFPRNQCTSSWFNAMPSISPHESSSEEQVQSSKHSGSDLIWPPFITGAQHLFHRQHVYAACLWNIGAVPVLQALASIMTHEGQIERMCHFPHRRIEHAWSHK